jgi:uncharacterized membrane protein YgaE (UPF0421/DUF939 family)
MIRFAKLSRWDILYSADMGIACLVAYLLGTWLLYPLTDRDNDLLGGMWAAVAAAFVFRDTRAHSLSAGLARLLATAVSFLLCWPYLCLTSSSAMGILILVSLGTLVMIVLKRPDDVATTAITTIVVMVVANISPVAAWAQPPLRFLDTAIGIAIGVLCKRVTSTTLHRFHGQEEAS